MGPRYTGNGGGGGEGVRAFSSTARPQHPVRQPAGGMYERDLRDAYVRRSSPLCNCCCPPLDWDTQSFLASEPVKAKALLRPGTGSPLSRLTPAGRRGLLLTRRGPPRAEADARASGKRKGIAHRGFVRIPTTRGLKARTDKARSSLLREATGDGRGFGRRGRGSGPSRVQERLGACPEASRSDGL